MLVVHGAHNDCHAAGFGNMLARPLFREKHNPEMSESEAMELIKEALKVGTFVQPSACMHSANRIFTADESVSIP